MRHIYVSDLCALPLLPTIALPEIKSKSDGVSSLEQEEAKQVLSESYQSYTGYEAYAFLLEVVLGLRSNLLGETEVFHQFRKAFSDAEKAPPILLPYLNKLCMDITVDSRVIRAKHQNGLGELSYGGLARRFLKNRSSAESLVLFGTGQLARKLLPWIQKNSNSVCVVGRNRDCLSELQSQYSVSVCDYSELNASRFTNKCVLIVAAPLDLSPYKKYFSKDMCLLDFRARRDVKKINEADLCQDIEYHSLDEMLAQINQSRMKRKQMLLCIRPLLEEVITKRKQVAYQSVCSWEDMGLSHVI